MVRSRTEIIQPDKCPVNAFSQRTYQLFLLIVGIGEKVRNFVISHI